MYQIAGSTGHKPTWDQVLSDSLKLYIGPKADMSAPSFGLEAVLGEPLAADLARVFATSTAARAKACEVLTKLVELVDKPAKVHTTSTDDFNPTDDEST